MTHAAVRRVRAGRPSRAGRVTGTADREPGRPGPPGATGTRRTLVGAMLGAAAAAAGVRAQTPAAQPLSLLLPVSPGAMIDLVGRRLAESLRVSTGLTVLVENVPGAGGALAASQLARRAADGRTLMVGTSGMICIQPLTSRGQLDYDPALDFAPVCAIARTPFVLFARADFPAGNLRELQRLRAGATDPVLYAGNDPGSANHVAGVVLFGRLGVGATLVPYRQNHQAFGDVVEGRVDLGIYSWQNVAPLVAAGRARILAVLAERPLKSAPSIATVAGQGFGGFDIQGWFGLFARKGTAQSILEDYERHAERILNEGRFADLLNESGQEPYFLGTRAFRAYVEAQSRRYAELLASLRLI